MKKAVLEYLKQIGSKGGKVVTQKKRDSLARARAIKAEKAKTSDNVKSQ